MLPKMCNVMITLLTTIFSCNLETDYNVSVIYPALAWPVESIQSFRWLFCSLNEVTLKCLECI